MQIVCEKDGNRKSYVVDKREVVIGRVEKNSDADLQLEFDPSISRRHLKIRLLDGKIEIEDLGSSWGTTVNGTTISSPIVVTDSDRVRIGDTFVKITPPENTGTMWLKLSEEGEVVPATVYSDEELPKDLRVRGELKPAEFGRNMETETASLTKKQLELLFELPQHFAKEPNTKSLANLLLNRATQIIPAAERGAVLIRGASTGRFDVAASRPEKKSPISQTLVKRCVAKRVGFIWSREQELEPTESMHQLGLETGLYAPLVWLDQVVGVICLDHLSASRAFSDSDLNFLMTVANYAGAAVSNLILRSDLERSLDMSKQLLESVANTIKKS
jgi:pSer/pThr/pTyr-binding forkhead associated (FHA) protein